MHASCSSQWLLNQHVCITVSRCGKCFWDGWPCATKSEKCEKDGKAYIHWKSLRMWSRTVSNRTECEDMVVFQDGQAFCFFCALLATVPLSHTHRSRCGLHGVVAAFIFSVFASVFAPCSLLTLSSLLAWQFWHCNNETANAATAENDLHKYTQLLVSRIFQLHY